MNDTRKCETSLMFPYDQQVISGVDGRPPKPPGKPLKFIVEDTLTGNQSSTWRIWTGKKVDDVYICEEKSGGQWKTSLHNDWGNWRIAMTQEAANDHGIQRLILSEEARPMPVGGWSEGTTLLIPCADLRPSSEPVPNDVIRIPISPTNSALSVRLVLQEPGITTYRSIENAFGFGVLVRPNGGAVYVFAEPFTLNYEECENIAGYRNDVRGSLPPENRDGRFVGILAIGDQRLLVDLALSARIR